MACEGCNLYRIAAVDASAPDVKRSVRSAFRQVYVIVLAIPYGIVVVAVEGGQACVPPMVIKPYIGSAGRALVLAQHVLIALFVLVEHTPRGVHIDSAYRER